MNFQSIRTFTSSLFRPIDIASLVYARVIFGLVMLWEVWRYFGYNRIFRYWIEPEIHFGYPGFEWLLPLPLDGMYILFAVLGMLSVFITVGFLYRISTILFFFGFTYMFLLEQGQYLNHFYFVCLLSFLMMFVPAHRSCSLDVKLGITTPSDTVPAWSLWLLRFQVGIVYFFGGIAKINHDWLAGEPLRDWLAGRAHYPIIGDLLTVELLVMTFAWGGMIFDLFIPFLLLWKPTRMQAFIVTIGFHVTNAILWNIGIFPWLTIALSALYFSPSWPRRFVRLPRYRVSDPPARVFWQRFAVAGIGIYAVCQILVPLRHWVYPGDVKWTEEGHRFSWRMKLRDREGSIDFFVKEKRSAIMHRVDLSDYLIAWQVEEMASRPDMIVHFAKHLKTDMEQKLGTEVSVHAHSFVSVNGRPEQVYFPSSTDLSAVSRTEPRSLWLYGFIDSPLPKEAGAVVLD